MSKLVYIASPFSKIWDKEFAVLLAEKACDEVARMGFYPVIIKNKNPDWEISAKFVKINGGKDYVYYLDNRDEVYKRVRL